LLDSPVPWVISIWTSSTSAGRAGGGALMLCAVSDGSAQALPLRGRAKDDPSTCTSPRAGKRSSAMSTRPRRGWGHAKNGGSTPCTYLCTRRRDAAPSRSGTGKSDARRRCRAGHFMALAALLVQADRQAAVLHVNIFALHRERRTDAGEGIHHEASRPRYRDYSDTAWPRGAPTDGCRRFRARRNAGAWSRSWPDRERATFQASLADHPISKPYRECGVAVMARLPPRPCRVQCKSLTAVAGLKASRPFRFDDFGAVE
jgi:hypothetical protein